MRIVRGNSVTRYPELGKLIPLGKVLLLARYILFATVLFSGFYGLVSAQTVIWSEDFEEAGNDTYTSSQSTIPGFSNQWEYSKTNNGRLRMAAGAGYYRSGSRAATLDANPTGTYSVNYLIASIDVSAYSSFPHFELSFSYMDHGDEE